MDFYLIFLLSFSCHLLKFGSSACLWEILRVHIVMHITCYILVNDRSKKSFDLKFYSIWKSIKLLNRKLLLNLTIEYFQRLKSLCISFLMNIIIHEMTILCYYIIFMANLLSHSFLALLTSRIFFASSTLFWSLLFKNL